ncbi:MAG: hypothetical protein ACTSU5_07525 [Promethearchaeota archaeon]
MKDLLATPATAWTFTILKRGELAYLSWNVLFLALQMYPGVLYLLRSCMVGFQHYHKANTLTLVGSEIFDKVFLLAFIFTWRGIGNGDPSMGELMTISFGTTFAYYMRDFFMFGVQVYFIRPMLRNVGLSLRDIVVPRFSREVVKTSLKNGLSVSVVGILAQVVVFLTTLFYVDAITQYTTFMVLSSTGLSFLNFIDYFGKIDLTAPFSEAYQNGKQDLAEFYVAQIWKYWGYVNGAMMFTFAAFLGVLAQSLLAIPGLENYALLGVFLVPAWFYKFFTPLAEQGDTVLVSVMHLKMFQVLRVLEEGLKVAWVVLMLYVFRWQEGGIVAIAYVLVFSVAVPQWVKTALVWVYVRRRMLHFRVPVWQAIVAPFTSGAINFALVTLYLRLVHALYVGLLGPLLAGIVTIVVVLVVFPAFMYPLWYGLLGGWDEFGLATYRKAASMAGPSSFFYSRAARITSWAAGVSPLTGRFAIPHERAEEEIGALMARRDGAAGGKK